MPRHPDPALEKRILGAASRLWARGGEKLLTMRAVAKAAGTTTPTVYERYRDRDDILRALRLETRRELFATLSRTRTLQEAIQEHLQFALEHSHAYEVLFDGVGKPPSLHEPWPSFNLIRERVAQQIGGRPREHNRLILAIWCLMHGTAMLIIRGKFEGALRAQAVHACQDSVDGLIQGARRKQLPNSGPKWPANLILGEGKRSKIGNGDNVGRRSKAAPR
ncbi:MAG TPA: TetR/AcrR family transcriptional regulator [Candidatus Sulfotelmatobacter sp.]|nr:TetR/AcrR family transcriptional regulator [Candidatus Sulfotelmatobacter sp.]